MVNSGKSGTARAVTNTHYQLCVGLPTLDLSIPGLPPLPPSLSPGPHPLIQLGGLGSAVSSPSGVWAKPQPTNDLVHI